MNEIDCNSDLHDKDEESLKGQKCNLGFMNNNPYFREIIFLGKLIEKLENTKYEFYSLAFADYDMYGSIEDHLILKIKERDKSKEITYLNDLLGDLETTEILFYALAYWEFENNKLIRDIWLKMRKNTKKDLLDLIELIKNLREKINNFKKVEYEKD